jgi:hypothetical protein
MPDTFVAPDGDGQRPSDAEPAANPGASPRDGEQESNRAQVMARAEHWAGHLRDTISSVFMYATLSQPFGQIDEVAYRVDRDRLLVDCGSPTDPIEVMIVEQLALAHFNFAFLQVKATNAPKVEAAGVYAGAAARLMGEFRRSALALQAYRAASRHLATPAPKDDILLPDESEGSEEARENDRAAEKGNSSRRSDEPDLIPMPRAAIS